MVPSAEPILFKFVFLETHKITRTYLRTFHRVGCRGIYARAHVHPIYFVLETGELSMSKKRDKTLNREGMLLCGRSFIANDSVLLVFYIDFQIIRSHYILYPLALYPGHLVGVTRVSC